jgi:ribosomal protein S18 acetylase RimI-like enzyme
VPTPTGLIRAKQTERLVAALIPPTTAPTVAVSDAAATVLPLPALAPVQPARFVHRTALLDDDGRVREATLFALLDWKPQQTVEVGEHGASLLVRATSGGPLALDPRGRLRVPDALRKFRGWAAGEVLLLSASPADGVLVLSPASALDSLVVLDACA